MSEILNLHILEEIGLTKNEAIIYLELLRLGSSLARNITRTTNMHRTSVYGCLQRLQKKGLVSVISYEEKTYYEASDPTKLLSLIKERETQLQSILPELKKIKGSKFHIPHEVQYYKGKQGLKTIFNDILITGKNYVGWGPEKRLEELMQYYFIHYIKKRIKKKIHVKIIYPEESKGLEHTQNPLLDIKYISDTIDSPTAHRVYGDKVAILLLEEEPLSILIRNKTIAESYKKHFNLLWEKAKG